MEGVELWLRWFLQVSAQSWRRHHPPRRADVERAKRRRQPGCCILKGRGEIRRNLDLRPRIVPCPSPCDRHKFCLWWISLSCNLSFLEKFTLLCCTLFLPSEHRSRAVQASAQLDFTEKQGSKRRLELTESWELPETWELNESLTERQNHLGCLHVNAPYPRECRANDS